jgi:hypothetical protein
MKTGNCQCKNCCERTADPKLEAIPVLWRRMINYSLMLASATLAMFRMLGYKSQAFQAIAHVFVGGLLGALIAAELAICGWLALGLSVVEVGCFLWFRKYKTVAST